MYALGAVAHLTATFKDLSGALANPTAATIVVTLPNGTAAPGSPYTASNDSIGQYHYDYTTTAAGIHQYYPVGTGAVVGTGLADVFTVAPLTTTALISLGDAKEALGRTAAVAAADDGEILLMIRAATEVINQLADYTAATTVTETLDSTVDRYGRGVLVLSHAPVMTVQTITPQIPGAPTVSVDANNLDTPAGVYYLGTGVSFWGPQKVTYTAGRATVPAALQEACRLEVAHLWETQRGGAVVPFGGQETEPTMFGFPERVLQLVNDAGSRRFSGVA
jgi:hypothetical protein